jgi:Lrp/AsnC family transcriptional regulator, leucine-responsive regulatory protein
VGPPGATALRAANRERKGIALTPLDRHDLAILAAVQEDARIAQSELGERTHLSAAAVNRRLKRMRAERVIEKYAAVVAPGAVGYGLTIVTLVEIEREQVDLLDAMKRVFATCPQIQQCYYVAGEWDFVLVFLARDMEHYTDLTRQLFFANNNVRRFKTLVAMSRVKTGASVPIE